jgi:hypothetical protein
MENKPSNLCEESGVLVEKDNRGSHCLHCGTTTFASLDLSPLIDQLVRSHAELSAALRWTGRQMLRFEHHDHHSLEKIRGTLRRAANIRKTLSIPANSPQDLNQTEELPVNPQPLVSQYSEQQALKSVQRKNRLSRPNAFRVIKFPTG